METIAKTSNTAYFTFGRFQPPTIGHGLLINFVAQEASKANADAFIFVSSTKNKSISLKRVPNLEEKPDFRNPLNLNTKITTLQKMFPDKVQYIDTQQNDCNNPFKAIDKLLSLGYEQLFFVVGSDRYREFLPKFAELKKKYTLPVTLISAGTRINKAGNFSAKSMSGTRMRRAALNGNATTFIKGTMTNRFTEQNSLNLMKKVRNGLVRGGTRKRLK